MLWLTWHMWILLLLAFAGGVIVGWVLHDQPDEIETPTSASPTKDDDTESEVRASIITPQREPHPEPVDPDDLTQINGLGPKMAERLNAHGVISFKQMAAWDDEDVARFDALTNARGRIERENWVAQAKLLTAI